MVRLQQQLKETTGVVEKVTYWTFGLTLRFEIDFDLMVK